MIVSVLSIAYSLYYAGYLLFSLVNFKPAEERFRELYPKQAEWLNNTNPDPFGQEPEPVNILWVLTLVYCVLVFIEFVFATLLAVGSATERADIMLPWILFRFAINSLVSVFVIGAFVVTFTVTEWSAAVVHLAFAFEMVVVWVLWTVPARFYNYIKSEDKRRNMEARMASIMAKKAATLNKHFDPSLI